MKGNYGIKSIVLIRIIGILTYTAIAGLVIPGTGVNISKVGNVIR